MRLLDDRPEHRGCVFTERERHTHNYPMRAIRTREFLYIRNLRPDRWPAATPPPGALGDIDASPTKDVIVQRREDPQIAGYYQRACGLRPEEELYDVRRDPWQLANLAHHPDYARARRTMRAALDRWMLDTGDRRAHGETDYWDVCPERR